MKFFSLNFRNIPKRKILLQRKKEKTINITLKVLCSTSCLINQTFFLISKRNNVNSNK